MNPQLKKQLEQIAQREERSISQVCEVQQEVGQRHTKKKVPNTFSAFFPDAKAKWNSSKASLLSYSVRRPKMSTRYWNFANYDEHLITPLVSNPPASINLTPDDVLRVCRERVWRE